MNILFFVQLYPPAIYGGGEYIFFQYAKELAKRQHTVFAIAQKLKGTSDFEVLDGIYVFRTGSSIEYHGGLPVSFGSNFDYLVESTLKGLAIIPKNDIDIIHSNTFIPAASGFICSKFFKKPHIITFHDVYFLTKEKFWKRWGPRHHSSGFVSSIGPLVEKLLLKLPETIYHTVSEISKEDLLASGTSNVTVIPNGIDINEFSNVKPNLKNNDINSQCIFIGRLVNYKNVDTILRAFRLVVSSVPKAKLVVVGDGPMRSAWIELAKQLNLNSNVIFVGGVSHEQKVRLLKESLFLIQPSLVEGFGIVLLEAFACKKPVLVSAIRPLVDIVDNEIDGYAVPPFDIAAWSEKIIYFFNNPSKALEMGMHGCSKLENRYTIPKVVDQLEELYAKAIIQKQL